VEFPTALRAPVATYETQFGCVPRPTHTNTGRDVMQYEVCGHRWADLSAPDYGAALLNDCKYGYSIRGGALRLSLLRAPKAPDPTADMGRHVFKYAFLPHCGHVTGSAAAGGEVLAAAAALNNALVAQPASLPVLQLPRGQALAAAGTGGAKVAGGGGAAVGGAGGLRGRVGESAGGSAAAATSAVVARLRPPTKWRYVSLAAAEDAAVGAAGTGADAGGAATTSVVLDTIKVAEDGSGAPGAPPRVIVRLYEALGRAARVNVRVGGVTLAGAAAVNLLEEAPGREGIAVGEEGAAGGEPVGDLLAAAPPGVRAAFAARGGPAAPVPALADDGAAVQLGLAPFQIATLRLALT
jgi:hypothetical protein